MHSPKIYESIRKFELDLSGKTVLTEAATGNYVVTPVIAALAGANVVALSKDSAYGSFQEITDQTNMLAEQTAVTHKIQIVDSIEKIDLKSIDIVTNTGFVRPIDKDMIDKLSSDCVIPFMLEPWEYRKEDIDLDACQKKGIKVYGTNEHDKRLNTFDYIGYTTLYFLLHKKLTPQSAKVLLLGNDKFTEPIEKMLHKNEYNYTLINNYREKYIPDEFNAFIIAEREREVEILGNDLHSYIKTKEIPESAFVLHISGKVDFEELMAEHCPSNPAPFGYMSYNTDFIDPGAVIDLHTAGLKVGEGMLKANKLRLSGKDYKKFMEENYPALAFSNLKYW